MYTVNKSTQSEHRTVVVFVVFLKAALKLKHVFFNLSIFRYITFYVLFETFCALFICAHMNIVLSYVGRV